MVLEVQNAQTCILISENNDSAMIQELVLRIIECLIIRRKTISEYGVKENDGLHACDLKSRNSRLFFFHLLILKLR